MVHLAVYILWISLTVRTLFSLFVMVVILVNCGFMASLKALVVLLKAWVVRLNVLVVILVNCGFMASLKALVVLLKAWVVLLNVLVVILVNCGFMASLKALAVLLKAWVVLLKALVVILVNCGFMASNIEVPNSEYVQFCYIFLRLFFINAHQRVSQKKMCKFVSARTS